MKLKLSISQTSQYSTNSNWENKSCCCKSSYFMGIHYKVQKWNTIALDQNKEINFIATMLLDKIPISNFSSSQKVSRKHTSLARKRIYVPSFKYFLGMQVMCRKIIQGVKVVELPTRVGTSGCAISRQ